MGAGFDRWLAKPSTIHFLRRLIAPYDRKASSQASLGRFNGFAQQSRTHVTAPESAQNENSTQRKQSSTLRVRPGRGSHIFNPAELGLQMSLNAGVPILDKEGNAEQAFAELRFQAHVNSPTTFGKLLVDEPEHRQNGKLWVEILRFRQRINGFQGIRDVWQGMRKRDVDLPVSGSEADILWTTFIHASITTPEEDEPGPNQLLSEVTKYAQDLKWRSGLKYEGLYKCVVGRCFRIRPLDARKWHYHLCNSTKLATTTAIKDVAIDAMLSISPSKAFHSFSQMYRVSESRDLYDSCIGEALRLEDNVMALRWHRLFMRHGDGPSTEMFSTPGVQRLFSLDNDSSLPMKKAVKDRSYARKTDADDLKAKFPPLTRQSMNTIVGDVYGIKPKEISDNFCARLFATRAFSIELVIKGLSFLGIESLGPLAIREMAIRTGSTVEFSNQLANLKNQGLKFGQSTFARIVVKLANDGQPGLWTTLLESDQHPDVYEDSATQEKLLISFLEQQNWKQAHIALTALSFTDSHAHLRAWNRVLQHYIIHQDFRPMLSTMQSIQNQGLPLTLYSMALMRRHVLTERRRTKRPIVQDDPKFFDPLDFVRNACTYSAEKGHFVPINLWNELLKRYGMAHRWGATERLVLWLWDYYSPKKSVVEEQMDTDTFIDRKRIERQFRTLRAVFSSQMLQALFTWGFRSHSARGVLRPMGIHWRRTRREQWARGLALLNRLHERDLIDMKEDARKAFQQRMWSLFGAGYSTLGINNEEKRMNRIPLAHYINHANEVWSGFVDWVDPAFLTSSGQRSPRLLVSFFGSEHRTNRKTSEYADVKGWAKSLGKMRSNRFFVAASVPTKKYIWERSSLRLFRPKQVAVVGNTCSARRRGKPAGLLPKNSEGAAETNAATRPPPPARQSPSAHSLSWHPQPSPQYIPEPL